MWKSAYVGVYQLLNCKMHGETLKLPQFIQYATAAKEIIFESD